MFDVSRPVENRIVRFNQRPTDLQLGTDLGYGLMGGSDLDLKDELHVASVQPCQIPIRGVTVWMYFVLGLIATLLFFFGELQAVSRGMLIIAGIVVIPIMMGALWWINKSMGDEPYLVFDKSQDQVSLPRLSLTFERRQLRQIVFLDRYVERNRHWQVSLLVEEHPESWAYVHLFNSGGVGYGMQWLGIKDFYQEIAQSLGIESQRLRFSKRQSEQLAAGLDGVAVIKQLPMAKAEAF